MGFRFRKSFGKGPFRVTVSKSGVGYSVGGKGFRVTKKAGGGMRTTASIPGTGISYVKDYSSPKNTPHNSTPVTQNEFLSSANQDPKRCPRCQKPIGDNDNFCMNCGTTLKCSRSANTVESEKDTKTELLLCIFLGMFGAHRFYTRKYGTAILYLFTGGLFYFGYVADIISIAIRLKEENCSAKSGSFTVHAKVPPTGSGDIGKEAMSAPNHNNASIGSQPKASASAKVINRYVMNPNTMVIHRKNCPYVDKTYTFNKYTTDSLSHAIAVGYKPCKRCKP